jgi:hypothetical protein
MCGIFKRNWVVVGRVTHSCSRPAFVEQAMPRFHLHIRSEGDFIVDEEGTECFDYVKAVLEAVRGARCLMAGEVATGKLCLDQAIEIHDANGRYLTTVPFSEALRVVAAPRERSAKLADVNR